MWRIVPALVGLALPPAGTAHAQIDPVAVGQGAVLSTTMRAHSDRIGSKRSARAESRSTLSPRSARYCADLPIYRARFGASDWRVQGLTRACRKAGL